MWLDVLLLCTTHPHSALWPSRRQPRCWGRRQQGGLHSAVQTVLSIYLLERVSMAKANLHQQEMQFHPRAARLSSSSLHKVAPSLCISLPKKCNSPSPLACPCTQLMLQTVCFFPTREDRSLPLLWSQLMRQRAVKWYRELFWFEALCWGLVTPFQLYLCYWLLWDIWKVIFENARGSSFIFVIS